MADASVVRTLSARDRMIAALIGIAFLAATVIWGVSGIDPSLWDEVAVAADVRPPRSIFPGFWRLLSGWMFQAFGFAQTTRILSWVGTVAGAVSVSLVYLIMRQVFSRLQRAGSYYAIWDRVLAPFFAGVAAVLFGVSAPLWEMSQTLSPDGIRFLLLLLATYGWLRWFEVGGDLRLYTVVALVGLLAAETPFAFLVPVFFLVWYFKLWGGIEDGVFCAPDYLPSPRWLPRWRMFFLFLGMLGLAVWANVSSFVAHGGLVANGWSETDIYFRYGAGYWRAFASSSTLVGWALGLGFGVFPVVVALRLFPALLNDDRPMPFTLGAVMLFVGFVAILQTGMFPSARFWLFSRDSVLVGSNALLAFYAFASAVTVGLCGASFAFECQRFYLPADQPRPRLLLRLLAPAVALFVVVFSLGQVPRPVQREAQSVVDDAVAETVAECGDAKWLFTDGRLDAGIEVAARAQGKGVLALNMMSGASEWECALRVRGLAAGPDRDAALVGAPALLRIWAGEKTNGMEGVALQLGFDLWRRAQKPLPAMSGLVAREKGMSEADAAHGIAAARALAERVVAVSDRIGRKTASPALASALSAVSWRLSRFARMRNDEQLADRLDATNGAIKKMLSIIEYERQRTFMQLTPQEGLEIALRRADFVEAHRYAAAVMQTDPKNPEANFGMAMYFLKLGNLTDAEKHLKVVLERRPDEPAALNNLSIICRKTKRYDEAVKLAKHALKMLPDSADVKRTLADAEAKRP